MKAAAGDTTPKSEDRGSLAGGILLHVTPKSGSDDDSYPTHVNDTAIKDGLLYSTYPCRKRKLQRESNWQTSRQPGHRAKVVAIEARVVCRGGNLTVDVATPHFLEDEISSGRVISEGPFCSSYGADEYNGDECSAFDGFPAPELDDVTPSSTASWMPSISEIQQQVLHQRRTRVGSLLYEKCQFPQQQQQPQQYVAPPKLGDAAVTMPPPMLGSCCCWPFTCTEMCGIQQAAQWRGNLTLGTPPPSSCSRCIRNSISLDHNRSSERVKEMLATTVAALQYQRHHIQNHEQQTLRAVSCWTDETLYDDCWAFSATDSFICSC